MSSATTKQFQTTKTMLSGMVCFYLAPDDAQALAIQPTQQLADAGVKLTPADEMHITLAYFEIEDDPHEVDEVIAATAVAAYWGPQSVATVVEGQAKFMPDDDGPVPVVLLVDPSQLDCLEDSLWAIPRASEHGFIPHITLAYAPQGVDVTVDFPQERQLVFRSLSLKIGDTIRHDFPLGGPGMEPVMAGYRGLREKVDAASTLRDRSSRPTVDGSHSTTGQDMSTAVVTKAVWSTSYVNDLPDSAFLYIESGGDKDGEGKTTPRSLRHFPYKDAGGAVDLPHLRNAIARIPQSNAPGLTDDKKSQLQDRARAMLEQAQKSQEKAGKRMATSWREKLASAFDSLKALMDWASYEDGEGGEGDDGEGMTMPPDMQDMMGTQARVKALSESFYVVKQADGRRRWLSLSSNGFEDREGEIVATKSLMDAVDYADATQSRGPLRLWHTPGADIGQADFQAVQGRFLIESGTFDETELAQAALKYFESTDEPLGVSIGFVYPESSFDGRTYGKILIMERSILPRDRAANPFTAFQPLGKDNVMDSTKAAWLEKAVGQDLAKQLIEKADANTKELEALVAYKELSEPATTALRSLGELIVATGDQKLSDAFKALTMEIVKQPQAATTASAPDAQAQPPEAPPSASASEPQSTGDQSQAQQPDLAELVKAQLSELIQPLIESQKALTDRLEAIEKSEPSHAPRATAFRASQDSSTAVPDPEKVKAMVGAGEPAASPVAPYIEDLLKPRGASVA